VLLNSSVKQTVAVYLDNDDDADLCYLLAETGRSNANCGTVVMTSGTTGKVYIKISTNGGKACTAMAQTITVPQSQGSCIGIVAADNGSDGDSLYDDAYVFLTWRQST
jgi:uncharacterized protein YuzE